MVVTRTSCLLAAIFVISGCAVGAGAHAWNAPWIVIPYIVIGGMALWAYRRRHLTA